jgi:cell division protein FtsB
MKYLDKIPSWLKSRYMLTFTALLIWLAFFDRNDIISQISYKKELRKLEADKQYYNEQIELNKKRTEELKGNSENLERYAREKYLMKKDDEEIFLIVRE